jgi:hypothetical protein
LVGEFAGSISAGGARVLYGRCGEELGAAYQPFVESVGQYVQDCALEELAVHVMTCGADLGRLVPEIQRRLPAVQPQAGSEPDAERQAMFASVACLLAAAANSGPILLVLDDLHWAPKPTVLLLRHLLRSEQPAPIMIIGTYRESELSRSHPLADLFSELPRGPQFPRLSLEGLDGADVVAYLEQAAGHRLDPSEQALAQVIQTETEGNPFFIGQLLRHLVESGAVVQRDGRWCSQGDIGDLAVPEGVRDVVRRRLFRLSDTTNHALTVASVIGLEFSIDNLDRVDETGDHAALLDALDAGVQARLIREVGPVAGRYAFSHALVRHTIYTELTATRRSWLHRKVGQALEATPGPVDSRLPSLAHHFCAAAVPGQTAKAADYAYRAGRQAVDHLAFEQAVPVLERGLQVLAMDDDPDLARRADLLLALADAWLHAGQAETARTLALRSADDARTVGSATRLAQVAVTGADQRMLRMNPAFAALAEEALAALGTESPGLRAQLLNGLAEHRQWFAGDADGAAELARQAIDLARQAGDDHALAEGLYVVATHRTATGSDRAADQVATADELRDLADRTGDAQARMLALESGASSRLEVGDVAGFVADTTELDRLATNLRSPVHQAYVSMWRAVKALLDGDLARVESHASELYPFAQDNGAWAKTHAILMLYIRREQQRLSEIGSLVSLAVEDSQVRGFHAAPLVVALGVNDNQAIARHLDYLAADDFAGVPTSWTRTLTMSLLAEACAVLDDAERAAVLYDLLEPHSGHLIVAGVGVICVGAADRFLAMLEATMRRRPGAAQHFEAALTLEKRVYSAPFQAHTGYWYARHLAESDAAGDRRKATQLLNESLTTTRTLGMTDLESRARALRARLNAS